MRVMQLMEVSEGGHERAASNLSLSFDEPVARICGSSALATLSFAERATRYLVSVFSRLFPPLPPSLFPTFDATNARLTFPSSNEAKELILASPLHRCRPVSRRRPENGAETTTAFFSVEPSVHRVRLRDFPKPQGLDSARHKGRNLVFAVFPAMFFSILHTLQSSNTARRRCDGAVIRLNIALHPFRVVERRKRDRERAQG